MPAKQFFSTPDLRQNHNLVVYGPAHLLRAAWLSGAQDYLREPWDPEELFLRLRGPQPPFVQWVWMDRRFKLEGVSLKREDGHKVRLSPTEAGLLRILVQRRGTTVSRGVLGWAASCSTGRVIDTLVGRLRRKLQDLAGVDDDPISGVRGLGYCLP